MYALGQLKVLLHVLVSVGVSSRWHLNMSIFFFKLGSMQSCCLVEFSFLQNSTQGVHGFHSLKTGAEKRNFRISISKIAIDLTIRVDFFP